MSVHSYKPKRFPCRSHPCHSGCQHRGVLSCASALAPCPPLRKNLLWPERLSSTWARRSRPLLSYEYTLTSRNETVETNETNETVFFIPLLFISIACAKISKILQISKKCSFQIHIPIFKQGIRPSLEEAHQKSIL